ncbi:hypothetical protein GCM10008171_18850 [Methylopila jiangsuensis]|uniref:Uncharacterized protein n=1 Tax=Methylopila jiangsuensis TaxID=586230 RepID=A0A9W6N3V3_9HYPH|nr:hypothetical protein [Methylopila jiangsuensis]MDR6287145.1 putative membrane protein YccC [Methylopila jiangsuensis]GLK76631.1 hypothetical protein GCM10008171_18850 [Methylopila jiangsuensis]
MSNVVQFRRPEKKPDPNSPASGRRGVGEFLVAVLATGLILYLLPSLWSGFPLHFLAVINLLVAAVYVMQGPRLLALGWIALSLVLLALAQAPSPVSYALFRGLDALKTLQP